MKNLVLCKDIFNAIAGIPLRDSDGAILTRAECNREKQVYLHINEMKTDFKLSCPELMLLNRRLYYIGTLGYLMQNKLVEVDPPQKIQIIFNPETGETFYPRIGYRRNGIEQILTYKLEDK